MNANANESENASAVQDDQVELFAALSADELDERVEFIHAMNNGACKDTCKTSTTTTSAI